MVDRTPLSNIGDKIGGWTQDDLATFIQRNSTDPMWAAIKKGDSMQMTSPVPPPQLAGQVPVWDGSKWVAQTIAATVPGSTTFGQYRVSVTGTGMTIPGTNTLTAFTNFGTDFTVGVTASVNGFTIPVTGYWLLGYECSLSSSASASVLRAAGIDNGGALIATNQTATVANGGWNASGYRFGTFTATTAIGFKLAQNSGGNLTATATMHGIYIGS